MSERAHLLSCRGLTVSVPGRCLVRDLAFQLVPGEFLAVLGQNGAGKTLTLHTLAGLRPPESGEVRLGGQPLAGLRRQQIARQLALLPQSADDVFPATVLETVLIGRHPHIATFAWESGEDRRIAHEALGRVELSAFVRRDIGTLSGGERRRAAVAQVLAQAPCVYLLDEPTNHLDPQHQLQALRLFRDEADAGAAVVASLHDVNLAVRFATRCLLLFGDGRWELGSTTSVLNDTRLSALYQTPMESVRWRGRDVFMAGPPA
ncbi:MAG TPA: ABC transporter ATP-binding protein [Woeseiaceae bacterium]|nr:ABC transporter ATP-binding protein [Woeseiaceae bacterium]